MYQRVEEQHHQQYSTVHVVFLKDKYLNKNNRKYIKYFDQLIQRVNQFRH